MDALPRAYATLGLERTASQRETRRRFRKLVRQWHPDRFANDPRGQAEAAERMRQINAAYDRIRVEWRGPAPAPSNPPTGGEARERTTTRLRREAVDEMVKALGTDSPVDIALKFVGSWWWWPLVVALLIEP